MEQVNDAFPALRHHFFLALFIDLLVVIGPHNCGIERDSLSLTIFSSNLHNKMVLFMHVAKSSFQNLISFEFFLFKFHFTKKE
jgi:hypothetical protein